MRSSDLLHSLKADTLAINTILQDQISTLSEQQLNWKPDIKSWSISECIEHIMLSGQFYIDKIENKFSTIPVKSNQPDMLFKPGIIGNYATKSMKPSPAGEIKNRMKTFKRMEPGISNLPSGTLLLNIKKYQADLLDILDKSKHYDLNKIRITSSIGFIIRFKLGDALRFVTAHNQRHIQQALRVLHNPEFPAS